MQQPRRLLPATLTILGVVALVGAGFTGTAGASAHGDAATSYTEDDDTNDGGTPNNVADDGDDAHPSGRDRSVEQDGAGNQGRAESDPDDDGRGPDRSNGGPDEPNGSGGVDAADQDGNNGCGNDDDFEDDNEGWCGRKPQKERAAAPGEAAVEAGRAPTTASWATADTTTCPLAMVAAEGDVAIGCITPAVLGTGIEVCPGAIVMAGSCEIPMGAAATVAGGDVLAAGEEQATQGGIVRAASIGGTADAGVSPSLVQAAVAGVAGSLAFTGGNLLTLALAALVALAFGVAGRWADRRRSA